MIKGKDLFILSFKNGNIYGKTKSLVSSIDIAPTILDFAGIKINQSFQGNSFKNLLEKPDQPFRNYVFAEHNWHDFESHGRMVRNKNFMLIENNRTQFAHLGPLDALNSESYFSLLEKKESGEISKIQSEIFIRPRPKEEFYNMQNDLFQRNNLIDDDDIQIELNNLRNVLSNWKSETGDSNPDQITKHWYKRSPGPKKARNNLSSSIDLLKTPFHGIRGEFPGASNNATQINNKGPF